LNIPEFKLVWPQQAMIVFGGERSERLVDRVKPKFGANIKAELLPRHDLACLKIDSPEDMVLNVSITSLPKSWACPNERRMFVEAIIAKLVKIHSRFAVTKNYHFNHSPLPLISATFCRREYASLACQTPE
jgi:hypothetical protein